MELLKATQKDDVHPIESIKMDIASAKWIAEHLNDDDRFPVEIEQCEECHSHYLIGMMHECGKSIGLPVHKERDENDD